MFAKSNVFSEVLSTQRCQFIHTATCIYSLGYARIDRFTVTLAIILFNMDSNMYYILGMSSSRRPRVAVVGAGVAGLPVAVMLTQNRFKPLVTLIAEEFSPNITSDAAGAAIKITDDKTFNDDPRKVKWIAETYKYVMELFSTPLAAQLDLSMVATYPIFEGTKRIDPYLKDTVLGFRDVGAKEKKILNIPQDKNACCYNTFVMPCTPYLSWKMTQFKTNGGTVIQKKLKTLQELDGTYDIIVNCSGLGTRELVNDHDVYPVRGQAVLLNAPWVKHSITVEIGDKVTYFYPRGSAVMLGSTAQVGDYSKEIRSSDRQDIISRCSQYAPSLAQAEIIGEWVGIRPGRKQVRLEKEELSKSTSVVHNYGHTGKGFALSIGCAKDTLLLVEQCLTEKKFKVL